MTLNNETKYVLDLVSQGNLQRAKEKTREICQAVMEKDTKGTHRSFCEKIIRRLDQNEQLTSLPATMVDLITEEYPSITFEDSLYYLSSREKRVMDEIQAMNAVAETMLEANLPYHNSLLLTGESGVGKTELVRRIAKELDFPLYIVKLSSFVDSKLGGTNQNVGKVFTWVQRNANHAILFLDEIDGICTKRLHGTDASGQEMGRVSTAIMQHIDQLPPGIILIGATNMPESLDSALLRRFQRKHQVAMFSKEEKQAMVVQYLEAVRKRPHFEAITWCEKDLERLVSHNPIAPNATIIGAVVQALAQYIYDGKQHSLFSDGVAPCDTSA